MHRFPLFVARSFGTRSFVTLASLVLLGALGACQKQAAPGPTAPAYPAGLTLTGETMGTRYTVKVRIASAEQSARAAGLGERVDALLAEVNRQMSTYDPQSELSRFNQAPAKAPFAVSRATADVVKLALDVAHRTDGAFDVTLGPLIQAWGFDGAKRDARPEPAVLEGAKAKVGFRMLHVDGKERLVKDKDGMYVNLSAVAKGWGVDRVADVVREAGFDAFMVEIGGEVFAQGQNPSGAPWTIGINVPRSDADPQAVARAVPVDKRGLATSGNYRNYFEAGGRRYGHIIDARTGEPVQSTLVSVSVLADSCALADALATTAFVVGENKMRALLAQHYPGTEALFISQGAARPDVKGASSAFVTTQTAGFPPAPRRAEP